MIEKILSWHTLRLISATRLMFLPARSKERSQPRSLRAISAQAGLVASVDGSLGALVNLWAHDERLHPAFAPHSR